MCDASHVKRNKYTGAWAFQKQCTSYCDVWLDKLLAIHTNPKSEKIYWNNSAVSSWPFQPWECAKVFMPRGQQPSNTGPAESDAQALLTLLANCTHFHSKLSPQGLGLTHTISVIRNKIIHDGEMKLSDADRMNFIQQIIQFLEDPVSLKSIGDCEDSVSNIRKIDTDSLDVFFNLDDEMTALRVAVNEVRLELGMDVEKTLNTADSLKEEYKQLKEQLTKSVEDFKKEYGTRMDTIESNVQQQVRRLDAVEENVQSCDTKLQELKTNTDTVLQQQEKKHQDMHTTVTQLSASVALNEAKLSTFEMVQANILTQQGNNSGRIRNVDSEIMFDRGTSEAPGIRRPESDGLRRLKNQTEDKLDTLRRLEYIPTTQAEKAKKLLEEKRSVVIKGNPGEGKTTMALHLIDNEMYRDRCVVLFSPRQWEKVDTDWVDIVILEDILGQFDLDPGRLQEWMVHLPTIQEHVDAGKLQVIITTRVDILSKASSKIGLLKLFSNDLSLTLSSDQLKDSEKMCILNRELQRHNKNMKEDGKEECITNFSGLIGFPQCCSLFAGDNKLFNRGPEFFRSPEKFFVANITELEATRFLSLAFLFCNGKIFEEYLSPETISESSKDLLTELASHLHISKKKASITLLRDAYENFLEMYVVKSRLMFEYAKLSTCIWFTHPTVCEAVGQVLGDRCIEMVVRHGDAEYLYQRTYTADVKDSTSQNVFIPVYVYGLLAERMVHDIVKKRLVRSVVKHSALKQHDFVMKLKNELHKGNKIMDFCTNNPHSMSISSHKLSEGECTTFMQYILQSDEDVVRLVYNQFLEFLACAHDNNSSDCWQCKEKQKLLELALYYGHSQIADKLIGMKACYTPISLCNAARHGDFRRAQTVLETLKTGQLIDPSCKEAKDALLRAYIAGNQSLIELFLMESIILDRRHVVDAAEHGDINALMQVVEHLKCYDEWNPDQEQCWTFFYSIYTHMLPDRYELPCLRALYITYSNEKFDMADYLLNNKVKVSHNILVYMVKYSSQQVVARVIQNLKVTGTWDPHCDDASKALETAYCAQKYDVCDLLVQEGVSLTMKNFPGVIFKSLDCVRTVVKHLKVTDSWNPKCDDASEALNDAYSYQKFDVCDLLVLEGVSLTMKHIPHVIFASLDYVKKTVKHLKDTDSWNPDCDDASEALEEAYSYQKFAVCDLLVQEGVSLTMKNFPGVIFKSLYCVRTVMKHLKDTDSWNPKCDDASEALNYAYRYQKFHVCDLLVLEGVSLTMKHIPHVIFASLDYVKKTVKHLKDTDSWNPDCDDASEALEEAYSYQKYDVCDLLVQEGVSLRMKNFPGVIFESLDCAKTVVKHLKDTDSWNPKCDDAAKALEDSYSHQKYDVCDLLVQEGVSLTMKHIPHVIFASLDYVKKTVKDLKNTDSWNPKCDDASEALEDAYSYQKYDVCDLLVQEGVSLTMKNFPGVIFKSLDCVRTVVKHLKDTDSWNPKCDDASEALNDAYRYQKYDVCDLLVQEGVSLIK